MKRVLLSLSLICFAEISFGQTVSIPKIDTSNYYDFYRELDVSTNWLRLNEVVPVIIEEMELAKHDWIYDHVLFKVDTNEYIVLAGYSRKSNFGFLYIEGHDAIPQKVHRADLTGRITNKWDFDYVSCEETPTGEPNFKTISKLPSNVFVLNENCYWYQYSGDYENDKKFVTKEIAIKILRQDIKKYLKKAKTK